MDINEKILARILFQNKIFKSDGQKFEDLFCAIMSYAEPEFRKIKPWGNIGDRKNDGYVESKGIFYQVYAPEDIEKNYTETVEKIKRDFNGLVNQWKNVKEFYFVINDKFKGVNADAEQTLTNLKKNYPLNQSGFVTADNLERFLFSISDDQIFVVIGSLPNIEKIVNIDYSILNQVIGFIMELPLKPITGEIKFPDWDEKIQFNNLSSYSKFLLNNGSQTVGALDIYLRKQSFLAEELQKKMISVYQEIKQEWKNFAFIGENIFWEIIERCSPQKSRPFQEAVIVILAKYFESCDIFEEPVK